MWTADTADAAHEEPHKQLRADAQERWPPRRMSRWRCQAAPAALGRAVRRREKSTASRIARSTASRHWPLAMQPVRLREWAEKPVLVGSSTTRWWPRSAVRKPTPAFAMWRARRRY